MCENVVKGLTNASIEFKTVEQVFAMPNEIKTGNKRRKLYAVCAIGHT